MSAHGAGVSLESLQAEVVAERAKSRRLRDRLSQVAYALHLEELDTYSDADMDRLVEAVRLLREYHSVEEEGARIFGVVQEARERVSRAYEDVRGR